MQRQQNDGKPVRRDQLEVRHVFRAERMEPEHQPAHKGGSAMSRQRKGQGIGRGGRQEEAEQEGDVAGRQRRRPAPDEGRGDEAEADAMVGEGERALRGVEERPVPPRVGERRHLGVPPQRPRRQQRIAEVVRHGRAQVRRQRPGERDDQQRVRRQRQAIALEWTRVSRHGLSAGHRAHHQERLRAGHHCLGEWSVGRVV